MIHAVRKRLLSRPRRWVWIVDLAGPDGSTEIERFDDAESAYGFCSWLNGGERPALVLADWERIGDQTVPPEEDDE